MVYDPSKEFFRPEQQEFTTSEGLFEFVVEVFTGYVEDIVARGILRGYRPRQEDLRAIRGRLLIAETVHRRPALRDRHWCGFSHFTAEIEENTVLRSTAHLLRAYPYRAKALAGRLRRIGRVMADVSVSPAPLLLYESIEFHRLNEHYRAALILARLLLENMTFTGKAGEETFLSFLIDMNWLFERVVGMLVKQQAGALGVSVSEQHRCYLDLGKQVQTKPDIVLLREHEPVFVLDAKYKLDPDRADVYQVLAYAHALGIERVALVHPLGEELPRRRLRIKEPGAVEVRYLPVDLSGDLDAIERSGEKLAAEVETLLSAPVYGERSIRYGAVRYKQTYSNGKASQR
jgi:5-methylcytosine-specific restriction enzyme subunit McrC